MFTFIDSYLCFYRIHGKWPFNLRTVVDEKCDTSSITYELPYQ